LSDEPATADAAVPPPRLPAKLWLAGGGLALLSALAGAAAAWLLIAAPASPPRAAAAGSAEASGAGPASASAPVSASASASASPPVSTSAPASASPSAGAEAEAETETAPPAVAVAEAAGPVAAPSFRVGPQSASAPAKAVVAASPTAAAEAASAAPVHAAAGSADGHPSDAVRGAGGAPARAAARAASAAAARTPVLGTGAGQPLRAAVGLLPLERLRLRLDEVLAGRGRVAAGEGGELRVVSANSALAAPAAGRAAKAGPDPAPSPAHAGQPHWHYGDGPGGPRLWGRLNPEYAACAGGRRQSPIDIRDGLSLDLEPLRFDYLPGAFSVLDNGHTVQVDVAPGSGLVAGGRRYALQQFHFHRPSEERIDGRRFDMDVHLVHRDDEGRLAVVAVLLERGAPLPVLQTVWNHLPLERNEASAPAATLDPAELLPADRRYYTYMGSLTTPPCSEGVLWFVLQQPVNVAERQVDIFARLYPMNARPLQAGAGRLIKQSN
jgi:carbonic anhydrase